MTSFTYRGTSGPWLFGINIVLCGAVLVDLMIEGTVLEVVRWGLLPCLFAYGAWALFWVPRVRVDDDGVLVRNVLRSFAVPWTAIQRIDTKYSLTLVTPHRTVSAWAAPANPRTATRRASRTDIQHLPESTYGPGDSVRPGDLPGSPSGQLAVVVRQHWEELRDAGALEVRPLPPVVTRWHRGIIAGAIGLAAVAAALVATL